MCLAGYYSWYCPIIISTIFLCLIFLSLTHTDQSYHVTVPFQPSAVAAEASLKLATPGAVSVVVPSTGKPIMEFPFKRIRRFGYQVLYGADVVWFETCECNRDAQEDFQYFVVNSGMEVACQIIHEFKTKIEQATGAFLIMEKADDTEVTYKARAHYGHKEFPPIIRARVLQVGLAGLNQTWPIASGSSFAQMRGRRQSEFSQRATQSSTEQGRRTTVMALLGIGGKSQTPSPKHSPSPLPTHSPSSSPTPSPNHSGGKFTLDQMAAYHRSPRSSKSHQGSKSDQFDSGVTLDVFDEARHSAPSYIPMTATPSIQKSLTRTLPSTPSPPMRHKSSLEHFSKQHGATIDVPSSRPPPIPSRRVTLDHLTDKIRHMEPTPPKGHSPRTFPSKDSTLGSADFDFEGVHGSNGIVNGKQHKQAHSNAYDHLQQNQGHSKGYDHLPERSRRHSPVVPPRSLHSLHNSPYVES